MIKKLLKFMLIILILFTGSSLLLFVGLCVSIGIASLIPTSLIFQKYIAIAILIVYSYIVYKILISNIQKGELNGN